MEKSIKEVVDNDLSSRYKLDTPNSSPRRNNLKPLSPHKNGNTVGRLSFLQSDNIDDHFDHIHGSHEEIIDSLHSLEAQNKQTQVDLEQLFERLKNNNQNLNRVLNSIAEYSKEVTEEGNATKTDVGKILTALDEIRDSMNLADAIKHFSVKQDETSYQIKQLSESLAGHQNQQSKSTDDRLIVEKLLAIETSLGGLKVQNSFGEFRNRVESLAQENSKQVNAKLSEVLESLRSINLAGKEPNGNVLIGSPNPMDLTRLEILIQAQSEAINKITNSNNLHVDGEISNNKQAELQAKYDALATKYRELERLYSDLNSRYSQLEIVYDDKLHLLGELQSKFVRLAEESEKRQMLVENDELDRLDKMQSLISKRSSELRIMSPLQRPNRVVSMPMQKSTTKEMTLNNSDIEE